MAPGTKQGRVRWFSNAHGYGFISDEDGNDVFVHFSEVRMEGYKTLDEGQLVQYEDGNGPKGPNAKNVVPLE